MKRRLLAFVVAVVAASALAAPAHAGLLGTTVNRQYYAYGGPYSGFGSPGSFVANGGVGGTFSPYFDIIVDDTSVTFDYFSSETWSSSVLSLPPTISNGIALDFVGLTLSSVSINAATNMAGFGAGRVSFSGSQLQVDWENLPFNSGTIVKLDVAPVPEPTTLLLLGSGCIAMLMRRRRD
jgi:hypothetical protein